MLTIIFIMKRRPPLMQYVSKVTVEIIRLIKCIFRKKVNKIPSSIIRTLLFPHIPLAVYDYKVNGRSPVEWIMERYQVSIDKKSGIKNDPNDWGKEHGNPPLYS